MGIFLLIPFIDLDAFSGLTQSNWTYIIATGFIHTGIVYYLFLIVYAIYLQNNLNISFLDPAVAILLDTVLTGFRPTLMQITGILFIFIGMTLTLKNLKIKTKPKRKAN